MKKRNLLSASVCLCALVLMLTSCCDSVLVCRDPGRKGKGPPAHAKAYGLRGKQQASVQVDVRAGAGGTDSRIEDAQREANTTIVNITNSNGSITPVTLRRAGNVWIGPKGEQYMSIPTAEQLKPIYGM